ncbi:hypothetical protein COSO111634_14860 [Corallococcus soli]
MSLFILQLRKDIEESLKRHSRFGERSKGLRLLDLNDQ